MQAFSVVEDLPYIEQQAGHAQTRQVDIHDLDMRQRLFFIPLACGLQTTRFAALRISNLWRLHQIREILSRACDILNRTKNKKTNPNQTKPNHDSHTSRAYGNYMKTITNDVLQSQTSEYMGKFRRPRGTL